MKLVSLSIGSNLGDRLQNFREAIQHLKPVMEPGTLRCSPIYETEPIGCPPGSPSFLNAVIEFSTLLEPEELLKVTQQIERDLGRPEKREINAPRPVDLDILLVDDHSIESEELTLPHPRMMDRAFVLCPLADLQPRFAEAASDCDRTGVQRTSLSLPIR